MLQSWLMAEIKPLPSDVAAQIKSSTTIFSLSDVVVGLVENALDAEARRVDVTIDLARASCTVEDDGCGIAPADFEEDGGLGKRYRCVGSQSFRRIATDGPRYFEPRSCR